MYQRCVRGDAAALNLAPQSMPETAFYPDVLQGDLRLSHGTYASHSAAGHRSTTTNTTKSSSSSGVSKWSETVAPSRQAGTNDSSGADVEGSGAQLYTGGHAGVVWSVAVQHKPRAGAPMMNWTIVPSTGLLLPGERCVRCDTVRHGLVSTLPHVAEPCADIIYYAKKATIGSTLCPSDF